MLKEIEEKIIAFRDERDWAQFHNPRTLAASICIESAELLEIFQWTKDSELAETVCVKHIKIEQELADIMIYAITLAHDAGIDIEKAILDKLEKNGEKYPLSKSKGNSSKYTDL
ncbi:MAG TPA: nucleotide pyrophosphohydrolase [Mesotoga infera]|jgi:NTP pyrophosphatase (non-canonical NTP hydrolase)|nr:nucleotide pyrophosphohydrolase [Mesotoga infera]HRV02702.1 nucleotide pyrophosphohydrolase [Mesotoga sp.]